ncbi:MAG TPA: carbohydrate-binding protein, partial [Vicinamibacterales bacterium]|nr:carbohydrate-binding protein [Vicinamibacterales bacterium]
MPALVFVAAVLALGGGSPIAARSTAPPDIVLYAADVTTVRGNWARLSSTTGAGGQKMTSEDRGWSTSSPLAAPTDYFEASFDAAAGVPYRLWLRLRAAASSTRNDSVWVQFSGAVDASGAPLWRIGTPQALLVNLEDCNGCGVSGWGWQDNAWYLGESSVVRFAATGRQTIRIQTRQDGVDVDQIVLSAATYFDSPPGAVRDDRTIVPKPGGAPVLVRQPYLQSVGETGAVVVWTTATAGAAEVRYRPSGGSPRTVTATSRLLAASETGLPQDVYQHEARLSGLLPATRYDYDVLVNGADLTADTDSFATAPPRGSGTVRFVAFGDSGTGSAEQRGLAERMTADTFDLALHPGDLTYGDPGQPGGTHRLFEDRVFGVYASWMRTRPLFPAIGNHEEETGSARAYLDAFVLPENGGASGFADHAERFYSFDYGPVHFVALDTGLAFQDPSRRSAQLAWLEADLSSTTQPWRIVYLHRPPYSAGTRYGSDLAVRAAFGPIFERYGVQLVIAAHEHLYERSVPWREHTADGSAVTYVVTGGGGASLYPAGAAAWTATSRSVHHYVRGTVADCVLTLEAVGLDGAVFDRLQLDRCAQARDGGAPAVELTSPQPGATVSGSVVVEAAATDDTAVAKVDFYVDDALAAVDSSAPYRWTWDTRGVADGAHTLEARAHDIAGRRGSSGVVSVRVANGTAAAATTAHSLPGTMEAEDFDAGANGTAYFDTSAGNAGGAYRATDVDIERCAEGGYNVGWIAAGEWLRYTVSVATAGSYSLELRVASPSGSRLHVEANGQDVTGPLTVPATGAWQAWTTIRRTVNLPAGTYPLRVVFDAAGSNLNWIRVSAATSPFTGTPVGLPGTVEAENFDHGGQGVAYYDHTAGNAGGAYRATDVDIAAAADTGGGYTLGWVGAGEWLAYTVNVSAAGTYDVEFRVASSGPGGTFHVEIGGVDRTGPIAVPDTGGWQTWRTIRKTGVSLAAGVQVWRLVMDTAGPSAAVG